MTYDDTKLNAAFAAWLDQNVEQGFGDHYAGDLLDDFEEFLAETKMMRRHPGRVIFGRKLGEAGFGKRKYLGLTYYYGLTLKKTRLSKPKRYQKTVDADAQEVTDHEEIQRKKDHEKSPEGRKDRLREFHKNLADEDAKREQHEAESDGPPIT
ncbi:MAG: hypothetical protein O6945_05015 [Gammaproteobacteria bacterium]|nr:hypothetical protein [Gammaproteobacteria bacterium]